MARQIVVEIIGDNRQFSRTLDAAGRDGGRFGNIMTGVGQGIGQGITRGVGMAFSAVTDFVGGSIQHASNLEQAVGSATAVYGDHSQSMIDWAHQQADATGQSAAQVLQDSAVMGSAFINAGYDAETAAAMYQSLNGRAADVAATFGGTVPDATAAMGAAFRGEFDSLEKYGITIKQADVNARLAAEGQDHLTGAARRQAEQAAIQNIIMEQSAMHAGAFARESDTLAGRQARAQAQFENTSAALGTKLMPIMLGLFGFINDVALPALMWLVDGLSNVWREVQPVASSILRVLVPAFQGAVKIAQDVIRWFGNVINFVSGMPGKIGRAASGMWDGIWQAFRGAINSVIRAWNNLGFSMPRVDVGPVSFGGFYISPPDLPYLHRGGLVPGVAGTDQLAVLQAGERVLPRSRAMQGGGLTINFYGPVYGDGIDELADKLAARLRLQGAF